MTAIDRRRRALAITLLLGIILPVAACGKKGDPEPPDGDTAFPRTYPAQ